MLAAMEAMHKVRLDKWLWAARFFRTRGKAKLAINGGKVHVDGVRAKPSKDVAIGETLQIRHGFDEKVVVVTGLSENRGKATTAATLYQETDTSIEEREAAAEQRKLAGRAVSSDGKPTKKQRRRIVRFREQIE